MFEQIKEILTQVKSLEKYFFLGNDKGKKYLIGKTLTMYQIN